MSAAIAARRREVAAFVSAVPAAAWPWRLPGIRHVRALIAQHRVNRHYDAWLTRGRLPVNADFDYAVCAAIRRGEK